MVQPKQQQGAIHQQHQQQLLCPKVEDAVNFSAVGSAPATPALVAQMGGGSDRPVSTLGNGGIFAAFQQSQTASSGQQLQNSITSVERSNSISDLQQSSSSGAPYPIQPSGSSGHSTGGSLTCTVCGDVATGRHYGSVACNGCKGFFRRTIRRNYKYTCRFNSNCQIDKHNRAVCRACRYSRCIQFGMKVDAVQSERDLIGKRSRYSSTPGPGGGSGSAAASPPGNAVDESNATQAAFKSQAAICGEQPEQHQIVEQYNAPSCSSTASAPSQPGGSQPQSFLNQSQYSSLDLDDPIPRKRSFSSGSRFERIAQNQRRQLQASSNMPSSLMAQQQPAPAVEQQHQQTQEQHTAALADPWNGRNGRALLRQLLCSEEKIRSMREAVIAQTCNLEYITKNEQPKSQRTSIAYGGDGTRKANENDILQSLHSQLLLVIEWAKTLKPFAELPTEDQTALLKNFAAQHVVLCVAYRSTSDFLKLINDSCIPRIENGDDKDLFYRKDAERVMDLLVSPMRFLRIDDVEFVALKACILFNPVARGLTAHSVMSVLQTRRHIFRALQHYVQAKIPPDEDRIGDLTFFILSPLQSLAKAVSEDVLVSKLSGVARLDQLMEELILEDSDPKDSPMSTGGNGSGQQQAIVVPQSPIEQPQPGAVPSMMATSSSVDSNASAAGQIFMNAATVLGGNCSSAAIPPSSVGQQQWTGQSSPPPQQSQGGHFICPSSSISSQQRIRHLSSSASSSSNNSPPLTLLQPVPATPFPRANVIGPLSPINESELSSSALSSYVFGASLPAKPNPPFAAHSSTPSTSTLPPPIANSSGSQDVLLCAAPVHHPLSPPSTTAQYFQCLPQFRQNPSANRDHQQGEFWRTANNNHPLYDGGTSNVLLFTPTTLAGSTTIGGMNPSSPQQCFGIGSGSGGGN